MKIGFIGGGTMGGAIIDQLISKNLIAKDDLTVSDISEERLNYLASRYGISATTNNDRAIQGADIVILAVKPQNLSTVAGTMTSLESHQIVLSIMAGTSISVLRQSLHHDHIIRAMPNMPAQIGQGMTIWTATTEVSQEGRDIVQEILKSIGKEIYVDDEKYIDMATALSGSGPAYCFLFFEALVDAGVHIGLPRGVSYELALKTLIGSANTIEQTGKHPAELTNMVTSPGGTTADALLTLEKGAFRSLLVEAVVAAYKKAQKL